ncbi:hypothetical protein LTR78_004556 [Recurvomyces mirabilis]|uniref:C3H1-type domain-containing protein n=1 Tax=Recurvomyces mirabilis TaxID=574656 RepID=A0AAE1C2H3_9PEZI|nr:hypothetical protein LTR78_004556 [Recurvomyces mirabilis]KAK5152950.1 hypothetical protein LTS14_008058 [Recurvomyces mirabilis]
MTTNEQLQAQIALISSKINQAKQQQQQQQSYFQAPKYETGHQQQYSSYRGSPRWAPYARGGRGGLHKNRTLVVNDANRTPPPDTDQPFTSAASGLVSTRGTTHQLMTKGTFNREQQARLELQGQQRDAKRRKRRASEQSRILRHVLPSGNTAMREMVIDGILFQLTQDGGKLVRVSDIATAALETPKRTKIVGVDFFRTKNGNLVRASTLRPSARYQTPQTLCFEHCLPPMIRPTATKARCENFTKHGTCPFGSQCHFAHDPNKVAICKDFLKGGACSRGANCDMSHEMTCHRVSACQFFLRGNCTNAACRYPHFSVPPSAPVCAPFATLGYCAKGPDCDKRHVLECPNFANKGHCANHDKGLCLLPHPDRASILRKAAERQAKMGADAESDLSSDEDVKDEEDIEDIDSEGEDVFLTGTGENSHELSQQQDFVGFN